MEEKPATIINPLLKLTETSDFTLETFETVMKSIGLKSAFNTIVNKLASILNIPKTLFKTWLQIQIKIVCFPFHFVPAVLRFASRRNPFQQAPPSEEPITQSENDSSASPGPSEPRSEDIVNQTRRLRNCVAMSIDHFTGNDYFWDIPILTHKAKVCSDAIMEGDPVKIAEATKALKEHPVYYPRPRSRAEYNKLIGEAVNGPNYEVVKRDYADFLQPKLKKNIKSEKNVSSLPHNVEDKSGISNVLKSKKRKKVEFLLDDEETSIKQEETHSECKHDKRLLLQNKRLRNQLITTNNKLEQVLKCSNHIFDEISKMNGQFNKLTNASTKITNLQAEVGEGRKLMREIEQERNEMRAKLLALEQMIKEEEEFLDDLSCESGYEDVENV